jgi:hypothetical protein
MTGYPVRLVPSSPVMTGTGAYLILGADDGGTSAA